MVCGETNRNSNKPVSQLEYIVLKSLESSRCAVLATTLVGVFSQ